MPENEELELTYWQKAVWLTFNPSGDEMVIEIKKGYASMIDLLNDLRTDATSGEMKRLLSLAITEAQAAQMRAVKAVTRKD